MIREGLLPVGCPVFARSIADGVGTGALSEFGSAASSGLANGW